MAVVISTVIANKLAGYNNNKPLFLSKNMLAGQTTDVTGGTGPETISACWRMDTSLSTTPLDIDAHFNVASTGWLDTGVKMTITVPLSHSITIDEEITFTTATSSNNTVATVTAVTSTTIVVPSVAVGSAIEVGQVSTGIPGIHNNSDSFQHPLLACDRQLTGTSAPYVSSARTHALIFACEYSTTTPIDSIAIANHNFAQIAGAGSSPSDLVVSVAVSDTNSFASWDRIATWSAPFTDERLVCLDLGDPSDSGSYKSYTQVRYLQVFIYGTANINGPQIGEVFAGPRRQLSRTPLFDSYDADSTTNIIGSFVSKAGNETRYAFATGRETQVPIFNPSGDADLGTTDLYSLNDYATLKTFWADTDYGTHSFFFLPNVSGKPNECFFMYADDLVFPSKIISGLTDHEVDFAFTEVGPFYSSEV
jgi:hypothetical protein